MAEAEPVTLTEETEDTTNTQGPSNRSHVRGKFCWVCGVALSLSPHSTNLPCKHFGGKCAICKKEGHYAKAHHATDEDAQAAMVMKHGETFRFLPKNPFPPKRKQGVGHAGNKKMKQSEVDSD